MTTCREIDMMTCNPNCLDCRRAVVTAAHPRAEAERWIAEWGDVAQKWLMIDSLTELPEAQDV